MIEPDLKDTPLSGGLVWFVDGSSCRDGNGTNHTGYAVVDERKVKSGKLTYTQAAEIVLNISLRSLQRIPREISHHLYR